MAFGGAQVTPLGNSSFRPHSCVTGEKPDRFNPAAVKCGQAPYSLAGSRRKPPISLLTPKFTSAKLGSGKALGICGQDVDRV